MKNFISYDKKLKSLARQMRNNPTSSEKKFWYEILRGNKFYDYRFLRQKILLNYIVDFYCNELLLAIELDGETHLANEDYDKKRTNDLGVYSIKVIRYFNHDISENLEGVCDDLVKEIKIRTEELGKVFRKFE